jgi:hypothetical protein
MGEVKLMSIFGLDVTTVVLLFGWIPFWWVVAGISLHRMNKNDERTGNEAPLNGSEGEKYT